MWLAAGRYVVACECKKTHVFLARFDIDVIIAVATFSTVPPPRKEFAAQTKEIETMLLALLRARRRPHMHACVSRESSIKCDKCTRTLKRIPTHIAIDDIAYSYEFVFSKNDFIDFSHATFKRAHFELTTRHCCPFQTSIFFMFI